MTDIQDDCGEIATLIDDVMGDIGPQVSPSIARKMIAFKRLVKQIAVT
jgi:hypothetical protein